MFSSSNPPSPGAANNHPNLPQDSFWLVFLISFFFFMTCCSSVVEDCEEAFVKNPDGRPLVLYLRTEEGHNLSGAARQLLERVNAADKAAKIKVCTIASRKDKQHSSCQHNCCDANK